MQLTNSELSALRSQPHRTNLWLSIYRPNTIMTARATGTYSVGDAQINYISASGSYLNLYPDLTVMVGSQPNSDDIGRIRMRAATGTYVVFAENAITVESGDYLTFLDYVTPEAIYPRIIPDPNNSENVIFYKDYNIPYSNQNTIYGTFPCAGPHRAMFLSTGTASSYWTATGTYNVASQALSYSWTFDGGIPSGSTALTPGYVTYSQPGYYKTRLRVTAANGAVDDTYRYVSVYNRPDAGTSVPTLKWEFQEFSGSRSEGGYTASFKVFENIGEVEPNALVVIFSDTWYGGTQTSLGGNSPNNSSIIFVGYIISDTIKFNYKESSVEFQAGSISEVMKNAEGFSVSCESKASPSTWFELYEMTVSKAMYHYLRWHSTILKIADFQYTGDDRLVQYFDADRGSLFDAVDSFMRDGMLGAVVSDRQGKLWAEINSYGLQTPFASIPNNFTFHKQDWIGSPTIQERRNTELSFIELGGIAFYGVGSNTFSALLSNAPSTVPLYHGKSDRNDGLILVSQQQINQVAGNYLAHYNTKFPDISLSLAGTYLNLDIAPLEQTRLVIDQNDSVRGKSIQDLPYVIEGMEWSYDSRKETLHPDITLMQIATGTAGQTVLIPAIPDDGGFGYPEIDLPPLPDFGNSNPVGPTVSTAVIVQSPTYGFAYTTDFDSNNPNWFLMNGGLTTTQKQIANILLVCPNGVIYCGYAGGASSDAFIARAPSLGSPWVIIEDYASIVAKYPTAASRGVAAMAVNTTVSESFAYVIGGKGDHHIYVGSAGTYTQGVHITDLMNADGYMSYGDGKWRLTGYGFTFNSKYWLFSPGGSSVTPGALPAVEATPHVYAGATPIGWMKSGTGLERFEKNFTDTSPFGIDMGGSYGLDMRADSTGQYLMGGHAYGNAKGKSSDGGYSWSGIPNLPPGNYVFDNAGSPSRWVAAGGVVRFSPDFGDTWLNREGNLTSSYPVISIGIIRVVG